MHSDSTKCSFGPSTLGLIIQGHRFRRHAGLQYDDLPVLMPERLDRKSLDVKRALLLTCTQRFQGRRVAIAVHRIRYLLV